MKDRLGLRDMAPVRGSSAPAGQPRIEAEVPEGWRDLGPSGQFRNASWGIEGESSVDIYMTLGVGGGIAMNLARWYGQQFGKSDVPEASALPEIPFAGRKGRLAEIEGTLAGKADMAALIAFYTEGNRVTSLKFTGPREVVRRNRDKFLALCASVRVAAGGDPAAKQGKPSAAPAQEPPFTAKAPAGWTPKTGSPRWLHHTFGEAGEVYLSQLGGSLRQTLGIWRSSFGQGELTDTDLQALPKVALLGDDAVLMELSGNYRDFTGKSHPDTMMLVAARADGGSITFCKLVGPKADVEPQRDAFLAFCASVRRKP
ncbi:MAG TPA: hypothetical protein ENI87_15045 [bacterium]|nr:hypothetical protein [bacterium]